MFIYCEKRLVFFKKYDSNILLKKSFEGTIFKVIQVGDLKVENLQMGVIE